METVNPNDNLNQLLKKHKAHLEQLKKIREEFKRLKSK